MQVFAPTPFRDPVTGIDYPYGLQTIGDDSTARRLRDAAYVQQMDGGADPSLPGGVKDAGLTAAQQAAGATGVAGVTAGGALVKPDGTPLNTGGALGPYADLATLNSTAAAATNAGKTALVGAAAPYQQYSSDGSTWQRIDNTLQGTQSQLFKAKLALGANLNGGRAVVCAFGDSTSVNINVTPNPLLTKSIAGHIATKLTAAGYQGVYLPAVGVHTLGFTSGGTHSYDTRVSSSAGVTNQNFTTLGEFMITTGQTLTFNFSSQTTDKLDIYYLKNSGLGTFSYSVNGGATTNIVTNAAAGWGKTSVTVTAGANTVVLTGVSGSSFVLGVDAWLSTAPSLPVFLCAKGGFSIFGEDPKWTCAGLATLLASDLSWVSYAANEWNSVQAATKTTAQYAAAVLGVAAASTSAIVMTGYPGNVAAYTAVGVACHDALVSAAVAAGYPVVDTQRIFGGDSLSWTVANTRGFMGGDTLHPTPSATAMVAGDYVRPLLVS